MTWRQRRAAWTVLAIIAPFAILAFVLLDADVFGWPREARGFASMMSLLCAVMTFTNPGHKWRGDS